MIGKLRVGLGGDPLAGGSGVMRQSQIFLVQLLRVAAKLHIRPIRFIGCIPIGHMRLRIAVTAASTSTSALCVLRLSHRPVYQLV